MSVGRSERRVANWVGGGWGAQRGEEDAEEASNKDNSNSSFQVSSNPSSVHLSVYLSKHGGGAVAVAAASLGSICCL